MKSSNKSFIAAALALSVLAISAKATADTADVLTAVKSCSATGDRFASGNYRWSDFYTASSEENLSDSLCTDSDINTWITTLKSACTTYFDVISLTPLNKGYAQYLYYSYTNSGELNGRAGGYGYSFTDRLVLMYRCL